MASPLEANRGIYGGGGEGEVDLRPRFKEKKLIKIFFLGGGGGQRHFYFKGEETLPQNS